MVVCLSPHFASLTRCFLFLFFYLKFCASAQTKHHFETVKKLLHSKVGHSVAMTTVTLINDDDEEVHVSTVKKEHYPWIATVVSWLRASKTVDNGEMGATQAGDKEMALIADFFSILGPNVTVPYTQDSIKMTRGWRTDIEALQVNVLTALSDGDDS